MPELPDVEALRLYLVSMGLVRRTITEVELDWPQAVRAPSAGEFKSDISGRSILEIGRRAKYLVLELDGRPSRTLILHLRMTGSLVVQKGGEERPSYTRNTLLLEGGEELCFVDPRKLGKMWLVEAEDEVLAGLGPEPLDPAFTPELLAQRISHRGTPVKALLCDQATIAGIGNIYADEILFLAGIHPLRRGRETSSREIHRLHQAIVRRLSEATKVMVPVVAARSTPPDGGQGLKLLLLPRSEGAPCNECGATVQRITVRARGTYFCPRCQRA